MGVEDYEPRVVPQLLEFIHRYVLDILGDAQLFADHANHKELDLDDIRLAVEGRVEHSFTSPPGRDLLMEVAKEANQTVLPPISEKYGLRLPKEQYLLTQQNFSILPKKVQGRGTTNPGPSMTPPSVTYKSTTGTPMPSGPSTPARIPAVQVEPTFSSTSVGVVPTASKARSDMDEDYDMDQ
ncbi:Transcription initiation factor TFIID subunit 9B [Rhizophlyctis rosea]|nr:Transcription initiation factor TFIID subunit 9B [Rhizophlyctis rosea]